MSQYENILSKLEIINSYNLKNTLNKGNSRIKIAGIIQKKDAKMSARGRFVTLQLSDQFGIFELTIFSEEILKDYVHLLNLKTAVIVDCDAFKDEGGVKLTAKSFVAIENIMKDSKFDLKLCLPKYEYLSHIIGLLKKSAHIEPNANITLLLQAASGFIAKVSLPRCHIAADDLNILNNFIVE